MESHVRASRRAELGLPYQRQALQVRGSGAPWSKDRDSGLQALGSAEKRAAMFASREAGLPKAHASGGARAGSPC